MSSPAIVLLAKSIALRAHAGRFRKDGVTPYFQHIEAVANAMHPHDYDGQAAAYLHDTIEDGGETEDTLYHVGIPFNIIKAVSLLTKDSSISYTEYISMIRQDDLATRVKLADMKHNLSDNPSPKARVKYESSIKYLTESI